MSLCSVTGARGERRAFIVENGDAATVSCCVCENVDWDSLLCTHVLNIITIFVIVCCSSWCPIN